MKKRFVLDTSDLIHDPQAFFEFDDNDIIIPAAVIYELDSLRAAPNGRGNAARQAIRILEDLRSSYPSLQNVPLGDEKGILSVDPVYDSSPPDEQIIQCAKRLSADGGSKVIVVSKDMGLRIKASSIHGVVAQDYMTGKVVKSNEVYTGLYPQEITINIAPADDLLKGFVDAPSELLENEFCWIVCKGYESVGKILCRRKKGKLMPVSDWKRGISSIHPKDDFQRMAMDVLMDPDIDCVFLTGVAGSGKTLMSLATAIHNIESAMQSTIMCIKPIVPVGRDLGYLKGDKEEKLAAWTKPFEDNLRILSMHRGKYDPWCDEIELEALTYMRGRTLHDYFVILDECQNTTRHEIKTALSRMGEKTKCVALADLSQIDNPFIDAESCGATFAIEGLKGDPKFACVHLANSQRSPFAQLVAEKLV